MATGQATTGSTTPATLASYPLPVYYQVRVKALAGNSAKVYLGYDKSVSSGTGYELSAGNELVVPRAVAPDLTQVWFVSASGAQSVCWLTEATSAQVSAAFKNALDFSSAANSGYIALVG